jgi:hypothetical protein
MLTPCDFRCHIGVGDDVCLYFTMIRTAFTREQLTELWEMASKPRVLDRGRKRRCDRWRWFTTTPLRHGRHVGRGPNHPGWVRISSFAILAGTPNDVRTTGVRW